MTVKFTKDCQSPKCRATFTVDGQRGNQKYRFGGIVTLAADDPDADSYVWHVVSSPPHCDYLLTGATLPQAKLSLPGPGAYTVQLTLTKGECAVQERVILWVATPRHLYRIPADGEALRFDGSDEWAGDLARVIQDVDVGLPTPEQKAALDQAHEPGVDNPFATLNDLPGNTDSHGESCECPLTADEIAALKAAEAPDEANPFVTDSLRRRFAPSAAQKAALDQAKIPGEHNPFVTESRLMDVAPTEDQKEALDAADGPDKDNAFVTVTYLEQFVPTPDQREALDSAEEPNRANPFVTASHLKDATPTPDQLNAIRRAWDPDWDNPFVTATHLAHYSPTEKQRAALNSAQCPDGENPYVTESHLESRVPTSKQREALDNADNPGSDNPFVTQKQLKDHVDEQLETLLSADDRAAIQEADGTPNCANPFVAEERLSARLNAFVAPDDQAAIRDALGTPNSANPFVTETRLDDHVQTKLDAFLSVDHRAAIQAAGGSPSGENPFVTASQLADHVMTQLDDFLSANDRAAIQEAVGIPNAENPFVAEQRLSAALDEYLSEADRAAIREAKGVPGAENPFVTEEHLTERFNVFLEPDDQAAIRDAQGTPNGENPFVTETELKNYVDSRLDTYLAEEDRTAIQEADGIPNGENPFVTEQRLTSRLDVFLNSEDRAAIQGAEGTPDAQNPFVTKQQLDCLKPESFLSDDDRAAIQEADGIPNGHNPFVAETRLTERLALFLDEHDRAAIQEAAGTPDALNPFITTQQLRQELQPIIERIACDVAVVATGALDLATGAPLSKIFGGLCVVETEQRPNSGIVALTFEGYQPEHKDNYIVKALPYHTQPAVTAFDFTCVHLVGFDDRGFKLQMGQPGTGTFRLGSCMIEVSEIREDLPVPDPHPEPQQPTIERAIKYYYSLIQQKNYEQAWTMLTEEFKRSLSPDLTYDLYIKDWTRTGPAIILGLHQCHLDETSAIYVLRLDYPQVNKTCQIHYEFVRDPARGRSEFDYWLFRAGWHILRDNFEKAWDQLDAEERERLGYARVACELQIPKGISGKFAFQRFEHGFMYEFEDVDTTRHIWVLFEPVSDSMSGASWQHYVDDWEVEFGDYGCDAARATGDAGPVRGFGRLWCNDNDVRSRLGNPVGPQYGSGNVPPYSLALYFQGGAMFYKPKRTDPLNTTAQTLIFFKGGGWRRINI